jgi:hypothetical protein
MTHRSIDVWLPDSERRCQPSKPCARRQHCARYLSAVPKGGVLRDEATQNPYFTVPFGCNAYVSVTRSRKWLEEERARKTARPVFKAPA